MNIQKFAYALAVIMLSYDVLSTMIASKLYSFFFAELRKRGGGSIAEQLEERA